MSLKVLRPDPARLVYLTSLVLALFWGCMIEAAAQQAVFLVRHAEQALLGGMMDGDPPLTEEGSKRAQALAGVLKNAGVTAIYVTEYTRSRETADPTAKNLNLTPVVVTKDDIASLAERLRTQHSQDTVMVVAHSDTIPALLKLWGHPDPVQVEKT